MDLWTLITLYNLLNLATLIVLCLRIELTGYLGVVNREDAGKLELISNYLMLPAWFIAGTLVSYGVNNKYKLQD